MQYCEKSITTYGFNLNNDNSCYNLNIMSQDEAYQAKPFRIDFHTPRLRNVALYATTILSAVGVYNLTSSWELMCCSPLVIAGLALSVYGFTYHMLNPDALNFHESPNTAGEPIYNVNINRNDIVLKPLFQPFKDIYNLIRLRRVKF